MASAVAGSGDTKGARARIHQHSLCRDAGSSRCIPAGNDNNGKGDSPQGPQWDFGDIPLFLPVPGGAVRSPFIGAVDRHKEC